MSTDEKKEAEGGTEKKSYVGCCDCCDQFAEIVGSCCEGVKIDCSSMLQQMMKIMCKESQCCNASQD